MPVRPNYLKPRQYALLRDVLAVGHRCPVCNRSGSASLRRDRTADCRYCGAPLTVSAVLTKRPDRFSGNPRWYATDVRLSRAPALEPAPQLTPGGSE